MFTIDKSARVVAYSLGNDPAPIASGNFLFRTKRELSDIILKHPGEWAVQFWNQLPGVTPIHTPPGEKAAKFRNRATAAERIWRKLAELYPDAILAEDMPKVKTDVRKTQPVHQRRTVSKPSGIAKTTLRKTIGSQRLNRSSGKSTWADELTAELRKRYRPGESFTVQDVYKLIPRFQRRHKGNHHIAPRLRTTLAQDLRGNGVVKSTGKGKYKMGAA